MMWVSIVTVELIVSILLMLRQWEFPGSMMIIWDSSMKEMTSLQCCLHMQLSLPRWQSSQVYCLVTFRDSTSILLWYGFLIVFAWLSIYFCSSL